MKKAILLSLLSLLPLQPLLASEATEAETEGDPVRRHVNVISSPSSQAHPMRHVFWVSIRSAQRHSLDWGWWATARSGWSASSSSMTMRRAVFARSDALTTFMPAAG